MQSRFFSTSPAKSKGKKNGSLDNWLKRARDDSAENDDLADAAPASKAPKLHGPKSNSRAGGKASASQSGPSSAPSDASNLLSLLDLQALTSHPQLVARFDEIAHLLLHEYRIRLSEAEDEFEEYEILELEFYLQIEGLHNDPFTHGTNEQKVSGNWCVFPLRLYR